MAAYALGTVLAGEGDVVAALAELRSAAAGWRSLGMPYEAARAAVAVGLACAAMGDGVAAALELGTKDVVARLLGTCSRSVDFIDVMPRLPTGKLYKKPLRDKYWAEHKSRIV